MSGSRSICSVPGDSGGVMGPSESTISESRLLESFRGGMSGWKYPPGRTVPGAGMDADRGGRSVYK